MARVRGTKKPGHETLREGCVPGFWCMYPDPGGMARFRLCARFLAMWLVLGEGPGSGHATGFQAMCLDSGHWVLDSLMAQGVTGAADGLMSFAHLATKRLMWSPVASVAPRDLFRLQTVPLPSVNT